MRLRVIFLTLVLNLGLISSPAKAIEPLDFYYCYAGTCLSFAAKVFIDGRAFPYPSARNIASVASGVGLLTLLATTEPQSRELGAALLGTSLGLISGHIVKK